MAYVGFMCSTPTKDCNGKAMGKGGGKYHTTSKDLLRCKEGWLASQGYVKTGTRCWKDPKDGCILVLNRNPQKPARIRKGKEGRAMVSFHSVVGW